MISHRSHFGARRITRGLAAPLAALASRNPAPSVTALAVTGCAGGSLAAASTVPAPGSPAAVSFYGGLVSAVLIAVGLCLAFSETPVTPL